MKKSDLTSVEIRDLLDVYKRQLNVLDYQVKEVKAQMKGLQDELKGVITAEREEAKKQAAKEKAAESKKKKKAKEKAKAEKKTAKTKGTGRRGRPPKAKAPEAAPQETAAEKPAPKPKPTKKAAATDKKKPGPTGKLSEWDLFMMNSLKKKKKVLINSELLALAQKKVDKEGLNMSSAQVKSKVAATLQKLTAKKDELKKVKYAGRGFAYALKEWLDEDGNLDEKYIR